MTKCEVIPITKYKDRKKDKYEEGAENCLIYARVISRKMIENPMMFAFVISYIRSIFHCLENTNITLSDIGTSEEELKDLVTPHELLLTREDRERRWKLVTK